MMKYVQAFQPVTGREPDPSSSPDMFGRQGVREIPVGLAPTFFPFDALLDSAFVDGSAAMQKLFNNPEIRATRILLDLGGGGVELLLLIPYEELRAIVTGTNDHLLLNDDNVYDFCARTPDFTELYIEPELPEDEDLTLTDDADGPSVLAEINSDPGPTGSD